MCVCVCVCIDIDIVITREKVWRYGNINQEMDTFSLVIILSFWLDLFISKSISLFLNVFQM